MYKIHQEQRHKLGMKVRKVEKTIKLIDLIHMNERHFKKADVNLEIYWVKI